MMKVKTTRFDGVTIDTPPFPDVKYRAILADPPWDFKTYSKKNQTRSAENHYPVMSIKDIANLPISDIAHPDGCVMFMWVTDPYLKIGLEIMEGWGFKYKTVAFTWAKTNIPKIEEGEDLDPVRFLHDDKNFFMGCGYWTRANPEMCLLGVRGKAPKTTSRSVRQLIVSPRREHSRKPDEVYDRIETLVEGPYMELFARQQWSEKWDSWGIETHKFERDEK